MEIIELPEEHEELYFKCLEDWSRDMEDAGNRKKIWYEKMKGKGLRVKLAVDDAGTVGGMIQYLPIEESFAEGKDLYFILCIWVHGHEEGRGNFQKKGMGRALLKAAEEDAVRADKKGIAAWGLVLPFWMKASWYRKMGYRKADRAGISAMMWKPFTGDAVPPRWYRQRKKPEKVPGQVTVTAFTSGWCTAQNIVFERAKRAASEFGDRVVFREFDTTDRNVFLEWGISDAIYIDGAKVRTGPPPPFEKIRSLIEKRVKKLKKR